MKIKLTEHDLHNIVRKSIRKILREQSENDLISYQRQNEIKKMALNALMRMGYEMWGNETDNVYIIKVRINNYSDCQKIENRLSRLFGINDPYELSVKLETNMFGNDMRAVIQLPSFNKVNQ